MSKADILVVDDNCDELRLLSRYLHQQGFYVRQAMDGEMAILAIETRLPDLIVIQISLSFPDGYQVCEHLKANPLTKEVPLIFLANFDAPASSATSFQLGAVDYLTKPYDLEEIGTRIYYQLNLKKQWLKLQQENQILKGKLDLFESSHQFAHDTTEQVYLLNCAIAATHNGLVVADALQKNYPIIYANPGFEKMTGYTNQEVIGRNCRFLQGNDTEQVGIEEMRQAILEKRECCVTVRNYRRDGKLFWNEISLSPVFNSQGEITHYIGIQTDVSQRKLAEEELERSKSAVKQMNRDLYRLNQELRRLANLDGLTGVGNRRCFDEYLQQEWGRAKREDIPLSLILGDIDYFKKYNDAYGHVEGDDCLKSVAQAILNCARRPADLVARWGGEEFAVILPHTNSVGAMTVARSIREEIEALRISHRNSSVSDYVTMSLGVATVVPISEHSSEILKITADKALFLAKNAGRNQVIALAPTLEA